MKSDVTTLSHSLLICPLPFPTFFFVSVLFFPICIAYPNRPGGATTGAGRRNCQVREARPPPPRGGLAPAAGGVERRMGMRRGREEAERKETKRTRIWMADRYEKIGILSLWVAGFPEIPSKLWVSLKCSYEPCASCYNAISAHLTISQNLQFIFLFEWTLLPLLHLS